MIRWLAIPLTGILLGCSTTPPSPAELFTQIEDRLLNAETVSFKTHITAEGAVQATFDATYQGHGELDGKGSFAGRNVEVALRGDAQQIVRSVNDQRVEAAAPSALGEGMIVGLTRMGLLHNLAMLQGGQAPDRIDGGVREWVRVSEHELGPAKGEALPVRFVIHVDGTRVATATLWIDSTTNLPLRREQVVQFPGGEMRVMEEYRDFVVKDR